MVCSPTTDVGSIIGPISSEGAKTKNIKRNGVQSSRFHSVSLILL